jgi:hypothetical protein
MITKSAVKKEKKNKKNTKSDLYSSLPTSSKARPPLIFLFEPKVKKKKKNQINNKRSLDGLEHMRRRASTERDFDTMPWLAGSFRNK